jgi:hypothetical protein
LTIIMADTTELDAERRSAPQIGAEAMYSLTLTAEERRAFDWVGHRYNSGKVADLLVDCIPQGRDWDDEGEITFVIPEHVAWEINELAEEESYAWASFDPALAAKLNDFCWSTV